MALVFGYNAEISATNGTTTADAHTADGSANTQAQLTETRGQGIDQQQASDQGLTETGRATSMLPGPAGCRPDRPAGRPRRLLLQVSSVSLPCPYKQW